jgi:hypothetical protein
LDFGTGSQRSSNSSIFVKRSPQGAQAVQSRYL